MLIQIDAPNARLGPRLPAWVRKPAAHFQPVQALKSELRRLNKQYAYFSLVTENPTAFNEWIEGLPVLFNDGHGTVVLSLEQPVEPVRAD